ncbi:MAG: pyruvate kinase [Acidimicrobiia bacterium]|nr:pyruvate kinase [Acidimicrobiia bacterium]
MFRHTKIVATIGPATASQEGIRGLIRAGMNVARMNFSHGDHETHRKVCSWVREESEKEGTPVGVLQDIQGPKLRVGEFLGGAVHLERGSRVRLVPDNVVGTDELIPVVYEPLLTDIEVGDRVVLSDGLLRLTVTDTNQDHLEADVILGGELGDHKGVAFPDSDLTASSLTEQDLADLEFGKELEVDYVGASFVRSGKDVEQVRDLAGGVPVIAKIELAAAYENLDDILEVAAGVMVARGDLGVQLPLERIPLIQNDILSRGNAAGRLTITATEMLESMTSSPRPTRAEVTDVATAVMGGTDAVMLSAETAVGQFPNRTVEVMGRICQAVEDDVLHKPDRRLPFFGARDKKASAVAQAAAETTARLDIDTIVAFTESGNTAFLISKYRPLAKVVAFSPIHATLNRMALYWGVQPFYLDRFDFTDHMIAAGEEFVETEGLAERGDAIVIVAGVPPNQQASTNLVMVQYIGERDQGIDAHLMGALPGEQNDDA